MIRRRCRQQLQQLQQVQKDQQVQQVQKDQQDQQMQQVQQVQPPDISDSALVLQGCQQRQAKNSGVATPSSDMAHFLDFICYLPKIVRLEAASTSNGFQEAGRQEDRETGRHRSERDMEEDSKRELKVLKNIERLGTDAGVISLRRSLFKSLRTLRLLHSPPLALHLGQHLDSDKKERARMERSTEPVAEIAADPPPPRHNYGRHLGFSEIGRPRMGKRSPEQADYVPA